MPEKNPYLELLNPAIETAKTLVTQPAESLEILPHLFSQIYGLPATGVAMGLGGIAGLPFGKGKEWAEKAGEFVSKATIYQPQTEAGRKITEATFLPFELLGRASEKIADVVRELPLGGEPSVEQKALRATIAGTAVQALPLLLGLRKHTTPPKYPAIPPNIVTRMKAGGGTVPSPKPIAISPIPQLPPRPATEPVPTLLPIGLRPPVAEVNPYMQPELPPTVKRAELFGIKEGIPELEPTRKALEPIKEMRRTITKKAKEPWEMTKIEFEQPADFSSRPKRGYIRVYRGVNPERNTIDATDPTHGTWYTTSYDDAVSYANWDYEGTGELGHNRAILAVDIPLKDAFSYAKVGSRRRIKNPKELLNENSPVELNVTEDVAKKARLYEGSFSEAQKGQVRGIPTHQEIVQKAFSKGKFIPQEVLADYPALQPKEMRRVESGVARMQPSEWSKNPELVADAKLAAEKAGVSPDNLEYVGLQKFTPLSNDAMHLWNVTDPNSPKYQSTVAGPTFQLGRGKGTSTAPIVAYHGTKAEIKGGEFRATEESTVPDRLVGTHFSVDPNIASTFAQGEGGNVHKVSLDIKNARELPQPVYSNGALPSDQWAFQVDIGRLVFPRRKDLFVDYWSKKRGLSKEEVGATYDKIMRGESIEGGDLVPNTENRYGDPFADIVDNFGLLIFDKKMSTEFIKEYKSALKEMGYDGIKYQNTSPNETINAKDVTTYVPLANTQIKPSTGEQTKRLRPLGILKGERGSLGEVNAPTWYSTLQRTIENVKSESIPVEQLNSIAKGAKGWEIEETGFNDFLSKKTGNIKKQEVLDYLKQREVKVEDVVKGKTNLAESFTEIENIVKKYDPEWAKDLEKLKLDPDRREFDQSVTNFANEYYDKGLSSVDSDRIEVLQNLTYHGRDVAFGPEQYPSLNLPGGENYQEKFLTLPNIKDFKWQDGHEAYSDVKNPIVRLRFDRRTDANGRKGLFFQEMQPPSAENQKLMPDWVSKKWREMAIRKMVRMGTEENAEWIGWTTGEQQAARYDLSKQVREVHALKDKRGYQISVRDNEGNLRDLTSVPTEDKLVGVVGKDLATKIIAGEGRKSGDWQIFSGLDLKVGGEGLKRIYDQDFPNVANSLGKKWGAKVGETEIATPEKSGFLIERNEKYLTPAGLWNPDPDAGLLWRDQESATRWKIQHRDYPDAIVVEHPSATSSSVVHSLNITPSMKSSVLKEGLPLFQLLPPAVAGAGLLTERLTRKSKSQSSEQTTIRRK